MNGPILEMHRNHIIEITERRFCVFIEGLL